MINIVKWAASSTLPLPVDVSFDEERLLTAIRRHRITGRSLHRLEREEPKWANESLTEALRVQQHETEDRLRRQLAATKEIYAAYAGKRPPILMKGVSAYGLTGLRHHMRYSLDIDMLAHEPELLFEILKRLGYEEGDPPAPHEFANMHRDDIQIDIHKYLPIWNYPERMTDQDIVPSLNPGIWSQSVHIGKGKIYYSDAITASMSGATPDTNHLVIPDPNMSVLMRCAHVFNSYVEAPLFEAYATVRLAELAEISDLVQHALFDRQLFLALRDRLNGHCVVEFTAYLMSLFFGFNPLPEFLHGGQPAKSGVLPRAFWWDGFLASLDWTPDDLLIQESQMTNMSSIVTQLGGNTVVARAPSRSSTYSALLPNNGEELHRVLVRSTSTQLPLLFSAEWTPHVLSIDVTALGGLCDNLEICWLDFGNVYHEYEYRVPADKFTPVNYSRGIAPTQSSQASITMSDSGYTLHLSFPWGELPYISVDDSSIAMMVGCRKHTFNLDEPIALTMLPLNVVRG